LTLNNFKRDNVLIVIQAKEKFVFSNIPRYLNESNFQKSLHFVRDMKSRHEERSN